MPPHRRAAAWIYTGPLGHLYGTTADIVVAWARWGSGALRERVRAR
jgi:hypothetical protein